MNRTAAGVEWLALVAAPLALLASGPVAAALLAASAALVLWRPAGGPPNRRLGTLFALAALLVAAPELARIGGPRADRLAFDVGARFESLWGGLETAADSAVERLAALPEAETSRVDAFAALAAEVNERGPGLSILLIDPDGAAEAWAGSGLLHEIDGPGVPDSGRYYRAGLQAATLAVARPLDFGSRPWRVVAGRTLNCERLPPPFDALGRVHWTPFSGDEEVRPGLRAIGSREGLWIAVSEGELEALATSAPRQRWPWRRLGAVAVAIALLIEALSRVEGGGASRRSTARALLAALGAAIAAAVAAGGVEFRTLSLLVVIAAFAGASWWLGVTGHRETAGAGRWLGVAAAAVAGLAWISTSLQAGTAIDLGSRVFGAPEAAAQRLIPFLWILGSLAWALGGPSHEAGAPAAPIRRTRWIWSAFAAALFGAAWIDAPAVAWPSLLVGAALAAGWLARQGRRVRPAGVLISILLAALLAGAGWESAYRQRLRGELGSVVLPALTLPTPAEREALRGELVAAFDAFDLEAVTLRNPDQLASQDLALAVWNHSPLRVQGLLSAVVVESFAGRSSFFSFGLPISEGEVDRFPVRGPEIPDEVYDSSLLSGSAELRLGGEPWGMVRYWALPRPGFRRGSALVEELAEGLLRGGPAAFRPDRELIGPARYMAYDSSGSALLSTWTEAPPTADLEPGRETVVRLEGRSAWAWAISSGGITQALFLPRLSPPLAIERVATQAVGVLIVLAAVALLGVGVRWRGAISAARGALRYYSKRLILVYSAFLLLPILALNGVAVRVIAQRLEGEQRAAGRLALQSASRILGEYVLELDPGFGLETTLNDALLAWISRVVRHEVNLYWGSSVYASSLRDLFTAGLLPERLPGEIYSRLALDGRRVASRTNRAGDTSYLELYGAVAVPGVPAGNVRLVLSLPLLAQEEELAAEIDTVRRRALLLTVATALLLAAIGARLGRSFTKPLMQVIEGTQRIASGAASSGVRPAEEELATLVRAIDQMAAHIAEGRRQLLHEKEVVERMIDHITSAVVSVDREHRVVMANRVARSLLRVEVGDSLDRLASGPGGTPLASALEASIRDGAPRTVRLSDADEEREWTLVWVELEGEGEPSGLLVVEDVTEVLRGQRLQAWAEMARIIAHEIKNPLTPIRLSAEHMREVHSRRPEEFDDVFDRCTSNILAQVSELQLISNEFLTYSRIPRCDPTPGDLVDMARELAEVYRSAPADGAEVVLRTALDHLDAEFDERLLSRALRNLVENAVRASPAGGVVEISVEREGAFARLAVADQGPGVPAENLGRIFEPYFSTHDTGTGLGLPIAQRIAEEHGGTVQARNRQPNGLEVVLSIPLDRRG